MNRSTLTIGSLLICLILTLSSFTGITNESTEYSAHLDENNKSETINGLGGFTWFDSSTLDSTDNVGSYSSLANDSNDNLHVTYYDATNGNLEYMTYDLSLIHI